MSETSDKKIIAGILAICLGGLGIHKFYLGYQNEGILMLAGFFGLIIGVSFLSFITCGFGVILYPLVMIPALIGLIEGIIYLTKTDAEFIATYVVGRKPWF